MGPCLVACERFVTTFLWTTLIRSVTVQWYKVSEQPFVGTMWQCMLGLSTIITTLISVSICLHDVSNGSSLQSQYGFYHLQNGALKSWQWLHITIALISLTMSVVILIFLPDTPTKARWATESEKTLLVERVRSNNQGIQNTKWNSEQAREAFRDPFTWCLFFLPFFNTLVVGGVSTFGNLLITKAFGFSVSH